MTTIATADEQYRDATFDGRDRDSDGALKAKDMMGVLVAAIMTLGPLAATALFAH